MAKVVTALSPAEPGRRAAMAPRVMHRRGIDAEPPIRIESLEVRGRYALPIDEPDTGGVQQRFAAANALQACAGAQPFLPEHLLPAAVGDER